MIYLFDIDGTLLLSGGAGSRALNAIFAAHYGIDGAMDKVRPGGKTDPRIIEEMFRNTLGRSPSAEEIDRILAEYTPKLRSELADSPRFRVMPWVFEVMEFLLERSEARLGLATGNIRESAQAKLEHIGLWSRFSFGGYGCDSADRDALVRVAIERGRALSPDAVADEDIVVIGDTTRDIDAARACNIRVVAVATGSEGRADLEAAGPDAVFDTLEDLPAWHCANFGAS